MSNRLIQQLISQQRLPDSFAKVVADVYHPICAELNSRFGQASRPTLVGINGCPGSGKSTMALFLKAVLESQFNKRAEIVSIDDFYKTKRERIELARNVHQLFRTRGVPGTHDVDLALTTLTMLKEANRDNPCCIPRFDKASDDRHTSDHWHSVTQVPHFILFEGWCVAATPQKAEELEAPVNTLEQEFDHNGDWRSFVNDELTGQYRALFAQIEYLIILQSPTPEIVLKWRIQQEEKLRELTQSAAVEQGDTNDGESRAVGMSDDQLVKFVMHYERLIQHMHQNLVPLADIMVKLDEQRLVTGLSIRT